MSGKPRPGVAAVVLAMAALVAAAVLKTHHPAHASAPPSPHLALAAPMSAGRLLAAPPAGQLRPQQVPLAPGRALPPAGFLAPGQSVDGVSSAPPPQHAFYIHPHPPIF